MYLVCRYQAQCVWRILAEVVASCHVVGFTMCLQIYGVDLVGPRLRIVTDCGHVLVEILCRQKVVNEIWLAGNLLMFWSVSGVTKPE